ncbi:MAG: MaoC-like dehydratase [Bradyrhizobium sp.]|nr:MaoC-like dehydratase [Bradyrhizobium sp.]
MAIQYPEITTFERSGRLEWTHRDTRLYALSVGLGRDPADLPELQFILAGSKAVLPSFLATLARRIMLTPQELGIDPTQSLHMRESAIWHRPVDPEGTMEGLCRVSRVYDKGLNKAAIIEITIELCPSTGAAPVATLVRSIHVRGGGGFGGETELKLQQRHVGRIYQYTEILETEPGQALLHSLCGDDNLIHTDFQTARAAGFERPILQGLCTFGIICAAIVKTRLGGNPIRLRSQTADFSAVTYPGETLALEYDMDGDEIDFQLRALDRDVVVVRNGKAVLGS